MKRTSGLTLVELLITLAIAGILLSLAVPGFSAILQQNRSTTLTNTFITALHYTRSEAIKRSQRVTLCPSLPPYTTCLNTGGHWEQGWIVFADDANFGERDPNEEVLRIQQNTPTNIALTGNRTVDRYISYTNEGLSAQKYGGFQAGTITLCDLTTRKSSSAVVLRLGGRPSIYHNMKAC